jgi:lipid A 4'-phosphatase
MSNSGPPEKLTGRFGRAPFGPIAFAVVFVLAISALFLAFSGIDLWASRLFHGVGPGFPLSRVRALILFRRTGDLAIVAVVVAILASIAAKLVAPNRRSLIPPSASLFLVATLIIGPGLLVNMVLKELWGRPRPVMVDAFGGSDPYVAVWRITDYCTSNCSFVAGEASSAIWLTALALVVPRQWRLPTAIITGVYAGLISLNRIAFGGHFLSDVLLSWGLTLLVIAIGYRIFVARPPSWLANSVLEAGLTRLGRSLRRSSAGTGRQG